MFMIALIFMLTIAAFWSFGHQEAAEQVAGKKEVGAAQMLTYHAAAARACAASPCAAGRVDATKVAAYLPQFPGSTAPAPIFQAADGRFGSISTGTHVVTYFLGGPASWLSQETMQELARENRAAAAAAMAQILPPDALASAGFYDNGRMVPRRSQWTVNFSPRPAGLPASVPQGPTPGAAVPTVAVPNTYGVNIPAGAPMMATRFRADP